MALPMEGGGWAVVGRLYWSDVQLWIDPMLSSGRAGSTAAGHARSFSKSRRSTRGRERSWNSILEEKDPERLDHLEEVARFRRSRWGTTTSRSFSTVSRIHRNILKPLLIATRKLFPFKDEIFQNHLHHFCIFCRPRLWRRAQTQFIISAKCATSIPSWPLNAFESATLHQALLFEKD